METIVQWATILSPIIAVLIAWWTVRSSSRDTAKKIDALEASTTKQIESIKELERLQLELTVIQINKELEEARLHYKQISDRSLDERIREEQFHQIGGQIEIIRQREDRKRDFDDRRDFYANQVKELHKCLEKIYALKKEQGGE